MIYTNWHPRNVHRTLTEGCLAMVDDESLSWLSMPCEGRPDGSMKLQPLCETDPLWGRILIKLYVINVMNPISV